MLAGAHHHWPASKRVVLFSSFRAKASRVARARWRASSLACKIKSLGVGLIFWNFELSAIIYWPAGVHSFFFSLIVLMHDNGQV